jgi:hypothetical protein
MRDSLRVERHGKPMTKRDAIRQNEQEARLLELGFTRDEAAALRRISMTLQRWFELECGNSNEYTSYAIERDEETNKPYMAYYPNQGKSRRVPIADRETGARKRLTSILNARNRRVPENNRCLKCGYSGPCTTCPKCVIRTVSSVLSAYVQTDPRGAALYIIRPGDVPEGESVESYYNRGICIY